MKRKTITCERKTVCEKMKIGIYAPHLSTYGGGEKYICKIAEILSEQCHVEFIVFENPDILELENRLNIRLTKVTIRKLKTRGALIPPYLEGFVRIRSVSNITKDYDLFLNQENLTVIPAYSPRNVYMCQVPPAPSNNSRISFKDAAKSLFFDSRLKTYSMIIVYSHFVEKWVKKCYPQKQVEVLYPFVDPKEFGPLPKENIILSVGRFFTGGHSKKQLETVRLFKRLYTASDNLRGWEYHLVGGVGADDIAQGYLKKCQDEAQGYPVYFHINVSFQALKDLYGRARIFWHATGLGENEHEHPERMEHFGMTTIEAMAAGCIPVVINKGGQPEIVRNRVDGFLWNTLEELAEYTSLLISDGNLAKRMSQSSVERIQAFSIEKFKERVRQIFMEELE